MREQRQVRVFSSKVERALRYRKPIGAPLLALRHGDKLTATARGDQHCGIAGPGVAILDAVANLYFTCWSKMQIESMNEVGTTMGVAGANGRYWPS
jgi:hypothetical protein